MKTQIWIALLAAVLTITTASAGVLYAIDDTTNTLLRIDPNTAAVTTVGSTGVATGDFGDLTYNPIDGLLYWIPGRSNNNLYTIDPNTGTATLIGLHGIDDLFGLAFDTVNNVLYGDSADGNLYSLDTGTGSATLVGANGIRPGGLVYVAASEMLYLLEAGSNDNLYMVDTFTGSTTWVAGGSMIVFENGIAFDSDNNTFWVASWNGDVHHYDSIFSTRTTYTYGNALAAIAFAPSVQAAAPAVPEPGTFLLLGGGLIAAALFKRRRG